MHTLWFTWCTFLFYFIDFFIFFIYKIKPAHYEQHKTFLLQLTLNHFKEWIFTKQSKHNESERDTNKNSVTQKETPYLRKLFKEKLNMIVSLKHL